MSYSPSPLRKAWLRWKSLKLPWRKKFLVGLDLQGNTFWEFRDALTAGRMRRIVHYAKEIHYSEASAQISPAWHQWLRHTRVTPPSLTEQSQELVRQRNLIQLVKAADERWASRGRLGGPFEQPALEAGRAGNQISRVDEPAARMDAVPDGDELQQPVPGTQIKDRGGYSASGLPTESEKMGVRSAVGDGFPDGNGPGSTDTNVDVGSTPGVEPSPTVHADRQAASMAKGKKMDNPWAKRASGAGEGWQPEAWSPGSEGLNASKR